MSHTVVSPRVKFEDDHDLKFTVASLFRLCAFANDQILGGQDFCPDIELQSDVAQVMAIGMQLLGAMKTEQKPVQS